MGTIAAMSQGRTIGRGERRLDAVKLVAGRGTFTDDLSLRGGLQGFVLTSPHPHARIVSVRAEVARGMPGVAAVLTHLDAPNLLHNTVRFVGDPVALIAALDVDLARRAGEAIEVEYEALPAILDPEAALAAASTDSGPPLAAEIVAAVGDVAGIEAERLLTRTYHVPRMVQSAVEPQVVLAWMDEDQRLEVRTSSHAPFQVRQVLAKRLGLPARRIRVVAPRDGGGFGGRLGVEIEHLAAALAIKTGRPVRLARTREDELIGARATHAQTITIRSGVSRGELVLLEMTVLENAGAVPEEREDDWAAAALRAAGGTLTLYRCPNVRFHGRAVATHLPPAGALRGDGTSQALFALESHLDEIAAELDVDPLELRRRHHVREGDPLPLMAALIDKPDEPVKVRSCGLAEALRAGARAIGWKTPGPAAPLRERPQRRGLGLALAVQTPGPLGSEMTAATIDMLEDGSFHLFVGTADLGAGSETVLCQIAAEVLDAPLEAVIVHQADTDVVPFASGPTRSSALYLSGLAVRDAAQNVRQRLLQRAAQMLGVRQDVLALRNGSVYLDDVRRFDYEEIGRAALLGPVPIPISGTASHASEEAPPPPYAAVFAEVEVDTQTGVVRVLKVVETVDCGQVLNPHIAEARIEGGALQGVGYALSEALRFDAQGRAAARTLRDYRLVTTLDIPEVTALLVPTNEPDGPFGAKSIGELPIHGVAPAVANAVAHAIGVRIFELPITPERVLAAIESSKR